MSTEDALSNLGGRKFVFALVVAVMAFTLTMFAILPVETFLDFIKFIFASYVAGNVVTKVTDIVKK